MKAKKNANTVESPFYTKEECAKILKCSVAYIDGLLRNRLVSYRVRSKMTRIDKDSFDHFLVNGFDLRKKSKEAEEKYEQRYQEFLQKSDDLTYHIGLAKSFSPIVMEGVLSELIKHSAYETGDTLTDRNAEIVAKLLFTTTVTDIEKEYGMTRENVRLILYKALKALRNGAAKVTDIKLENERLTERTTRQTEHIRLLEEENKKLRAKVKQYPDKKEWRKRMLNSSISLNELQLPVRAIHIFHDKNVNTVADLMNYSVQDLNDLKGFGRKCVDETVYALSRIGVRLRTK